MNDVGNDSGNDLSSVRELCNGNASRLKDGWRDLVYMEQLRILVAGQLKVVDALLCLNHDNSTYPTKLYLAENLGAGLNWNETCYLLSRNWYTYSWSGVQPNQRLIDILAAHLAPLAKAQAA